MNLIIDVGNTRVKLAIFKEDALVDKKTTTLESLLEALSQIDLAYPSVRWAIVSSVGNLSENQLATLKNRYDLVMLSHQTAVPFLNEYSTPKTLGVDRIALMSAAAIQYPKKNLLVIDAGSCITYDFLTDENKYLGGAISPGITMRYEALHTFTANLPLLEADLPEKLIGDSTNSSIHVGVIGAILNEIQGFISSYKKKFGELTIILTGGDAHFLRDSLKNDIFANSNFLLEGLNYILEHNKD